MHGDVTKEIESMLKSFENPDVTEAPATESSVTQAPSTEAPGTEAPSTNAPSTEAPTTNAPATEAPTTQPPDDRDKTIEDLRRQVEELSGKKAAPKTEAPKTEAPATQPPVSTEPQDFIGDADVEELIHDKESLNKLLNAVYQKALNDSKVGLGESVLRSIPDIVRTNITLVTKLNEIKNQFYEDNKDLVPFPKVVGAVMEELVSANPGKKYEEIMSGLGEEVRKRLGLQKKAAPKQGDPPPKLHGNKNKGPRGGGKPNLDKMQQELDEMNESIGR